MKTLLLPCLLFLIGGTAAFAQNPTFDKFFDQYADRKGIVTVKLSNFPVDLLTSGEKDCDLKINSLRVLTVEDLDLNAKVNFYDEIVPGINRNAYEELLTIKRKGENSIMLCKRDKKRITELVYVSGGEKNVMVEITGSMSLEQAKKMTKEVSESDDSKEHHNENE